MNMLGKILVVLIFIMSIFFMAFSFMVFMTQTSWKTKYNTASSEAQSARSSNNQLEAQIAALKTQRAAENAARTNAIALLEANLSSSEQAVSDMQQDLTRLRTQEQQQGTQVTASVETLQSERKKVDALQQIVKAAQADRDKMFADVVDLKNSVLELEAVKQRLTASESALLDQVNRQASVLRAYDLNENADIAKVAPKRDGRIKQIDSLSKYVVISLGSDDGMQRGHKLDVHRGKKYLGKVQLTKTHPDRSIGVVLDDYRKGAMRSGDSVRTK